jgi:hypothetical protein
VRVLTYKLVERLRPFVEAKSPGGAGDEETAAWEGRMRRKADELKLESFGIELLHAIGTVYVTKATSFLKSKKFLGDVSSTRLFYFLSQLFFLKSWILVKVEGEGRGSERRVGRDWQRVCIPPHTHALLDPNRIDFACRPSVQQVMQDVDRAQLKGDASEEELKALEIDVTGKMMLSSWRATRFEVVQVLRGVRV